MNRTQWINTLCRMVALVTIFALADGALCQSSKEKEIPVYEAATDSPLSFINTTSHWIKGSDYTPLARKVSGPNGKALEFTFQGKQGIARSTLCVQKRVDQLVGEGYTGSRGSA